MRKVLLIVAVVFACVATQAGEYTFNTQTGELRLVAGIFSSSDKWGNDVVASAVTSVTADAGVSFSGNCDDMFANLVNSTSIDLHNVNTSAVTNMSNMFESCSRLVSLDISGWDTGNVLLMNNMFYGCSSLASLDLSDFDTGSVGYMNGMFYGCSSLTTLDLSSFRTANLMKVSEMFAGCSSLATIYVGTGWTTANVDYADNMFTGCTALVGGKGTSYDASHTGSDYARFDLGTDTPGYFTGVFALTLPEDVTAEAVATVTHRDKSLYVPGTPVALSYTGALPEQMMAFFSMNGTALVDNTFEMPFEDATVTVTISTINYRVYLPTDLEHATVTSDKARAYPDDTVTLTVTPDEGYAISSVAVMNGEMSVEVIPGDDGIYTFVMPGANVNVIVELQRLRYALNSGTGALTLYYGEFNSGNKWGDDVNPAAVVSVNATSDVSFTGNCSELFSGFLNCTNMDLHLANTSKVTNMGGMFYSCSSLTSLDVSTFDTSNVLVMGSMFAGCSALSTLDLTDWDTSNVRDMAGMFASCGSLTSLALVGWNTAAVRSTRFMFSDCSSLSTLAISSWDTSSITDMCNMFYGCSSLTTLNVSSWNTGNVANMSGLFYGCSSLSALDLLKWSTASATDMSSMFNGCSSLTTLDLSGWNTGNVSNMSSIFVACTNLTTIYAGAGWSIENVPNSAMFSGCTSLKGGRGTTYDENHIDNLYARFDRGADEPGYLTGVFSLSLPEDVTATPVPTLTHDDSNLYAAGTSVTLSYSGELPEHIIVVYSVNGTVIGGDTFEMPYGDVSVTFELQRLEYSFDNQTGELKLLYGDFNKYKKWGSDVTGWQVRSITATDDVSFSGDCSRLFYGLTNCRNIDLSCVNTQDVTNMSGMFANNSALTSLNISDWDTSGATNLESMFKGCAALPSLNITDWNVANVTDMSYMFDACLTLASLDLSGWDTGNVSSMENMFIGCASLSALDLSGWDTGNVTNMMSMFMGCTNLTTIYVGEGWSTTNVSASSGMFHNCSALVGGKGTTFDANYDDSTYARIDRGGDEQGYLTGVFTISIPEYEHGQVAASVGDKPLTNGDLVITDATVTLTITPDGGYEMESLTVTIDGAAPQRLRLRGGSIPLTPGDEPNIYTFQMPPYPVTVNATFKKTIILGDLNGDGLIDGSDVSAMLEIMLDGGDITPEQLAAGDFDGSGTIDGNDVSALLEIVLSGE